MNRPQLVVLILTAAFLTPQAIRAQTPANDSFSQPEVILSLPFVATGSTVDATFEPDEPWTQAWAWGSVWYSWIADTTGVVQVDSAGSTSATVIAVWTGDALTSLVHIVESSFFNEDIQSLVMFEAQSGATYRIGVYSSPGYSDPGGFMLNMSNATANRISGHVISTDTSLALTNMGVIIYRWAGGIWNWHNEQETDSAGNYLSPPLPDGTYRVEFFDWNSGDYQQEFFDNQRTLMDGSNLVLAAGTFAGNVNASLETAAKISGTVTEEDGITPIEDVYVGVYRNLGSGWEEFRSALTDTNGLFLVGGLSTGTYRIVFDTFSVPRFADEAFSNAADVASGTDIMVNTISIVSNINASLGPAPGISGTVTQPDGTTPLPDFEVNAYSWNGSWWAWAGYASTATDGTYTVYVPMAGAYRVEFGYYDHPLYLPQVFDRASDLDSGTDIVTTSGMITTGINVRMSAGASISGTVTAPDMSTPLEGIEVFDLIGTDIASNGTWNGYWTGSPVYTDSNGFYTLSMLATGYHRVEFSDPANKHITKAYSNAPVGWHSMAQTITISNLDQVVTGIDVFLDPAVYIAGLVAEENGVTPLTNATVYAIRQTSNGWEWITGVYSDSDGTFALGDIPPGTYRIFADEDSGLYIGEYYQDAYVDTNAQLIVLASYEMQTNVVITLSSITNAAANLVGFTKTAGFSDHYVVHYYTGIPWQSYQIQATHSLTGGWHDVGDQYLSVSGTNTIGWISTNAPYFWRIRYVP